MALEFCDKCKSMHYRTDACRAPKSGGKPSEANVPQTGRVGNPSPPPQMRQPDEPDGETERSLRPSQGGSVGGAGQSLIIGKRRGRPQTITDMKAYKAEKERQRRIDGKVKPRAKK